MQLLTSQLYLLANKGGQGASRSLRMLFDAQAEALLEIYAHETGHSYLRKTPRPAETLADSLNNRALSLFDLGKIEEAKRVWEQALKVDPLHLETNYNWRVVLWRQGELASDVLVPQLERVRTMQGETWQASYLLAQVHLEQGDVDAASSLLWEAARQAPEEAEVQALLKQARSDDIPSRRCLRVLQGHADAVRSVSWSADGRFALSGSLDQTVRLWETATGHCLRVLQGHTDAVTSVSLSADGRFALSGSSDGTLRLWELEWELEARDLAEWDQGAQPCLERFLSSHSAGKNWLGRWKKPKWEEQDFQGLLMELGYCGYGWLLPEGVRRRLEQMAKEWQGPQNNPFGPRIPSAPSTADRPGQPNAYDDIEYQSQQMLGLFTFSIIGVFFSVLGIARLASGNDTLPTITFLLFGLAFFAIIGLTYI
jgi:tetratricopeptide (TPR) repeat protein